MRRRARLGFRDFEGGVMRFPAIRARQSATHEVVSFAASVEQIKAIAAIDRVRRDADGSLHGFQRPMVANHIREIRDYLQRPDAVMPNAIVLAFTEGITVTERDSCSVEIEIDVSGGPVGVVVDGQQRLTALGGLSSGDFQLLVSALICKDQDELRRQFILVNNTSPLPKSLIYELLPGVEGLPRRMTSRARAAHIVEMLNFDNRSSLRGQIKQHTNPQGVISDTALQRMVMNSLSDGYCRTVIDSHDGPEKCFLAISEFFLAVQQVFDQAWVGHNPRSSRLVHSTGLISMGYVMDQLCSAGAPLAPLFKLGLKKLEGKTSWTAGHGDWHFQSGVRPWNGIQNLHQDIHVLTDYLTRLLRRADGI